MFLQTRLRAVIALLAGLLASVATCFGQFGDPDKFIEGRTLENLQKSMTISPMADHMAFVSRPVAELERTWIETNYVEGTAPYYFSYQTDKGTTNGYCLVKNGIVVSSFVWTKDYIPPAESKVTAPSTLQADVQAESIQPAGYPVLLTLTLTNNAKVPFEYFCGGPGAYPSATLFSAEVVNEAEQTQKIELANGQRVWGVGHENSLASGETIVIPASAGVLPVGSYHIKVGDGKDAPVTVKASAELEGVEIQKIIAGIREDNPFVEYVTTHYKLAQVLNAFTTADIVAEVRKGNSFFEKLSFDQKIQPVMKALEADLTSTDVNVVSRAAGTIQFYGNPPTIFTQGIIKAMHQQLDGSGGNPRLELILAWIAGEIGSDDAMTTVLDLLHSKTSGLSENDRADVVDRLAEFKQQRATDELRRLLKDPEVAVRVKAALVLAQRKDRACIEVLITQAGKSNLDVPGLPPPCVDAYDALLNFPDDPRVEPAIKRGLDNEDSYIRHNAEETLKTLRTICIVESHGVVL